MSASSILPLLPFFSLGPAKVDGDKHASTRTRQSTHESVVTVELFSGALPALFFTSTRYVQSTATLRLGSVASVCPAVAQAFDVTETYIEMGTLAVIGPRAGKIKKGPRKIEGCWQVPKHGWIETTTIECIRERASEEPNTSSSRSTQPNRLMLIRCAACHAMPVAHGWAMDKTRGENSRHRYEFDGPGGLFLHSHQTLPPDRDTPIKDQAGRGSPT